MPICPGTLAEPSLFEFECSLGPQCAVGWLIEAVQVHPGDVEGAEIACQVRDAHTDGGVVDGRDSSIEEMG